MGGAKQEQLKQEKVDVARGLCLSIGALEECVVHEGEYSDTLEFLDMDELTQRILDEDPDALKLFKDKAEMTECVSDAMQSAGEECGYCANNRDSD